MYLVENLFLSVSRFCGKFAIGQSFAAWYRQLLTRRSHPRYALESLVPFELSAAALRVYYVFTLLLHMLRVSPTLLKGGGGKGLQQVDAGFAAKGQRTRVHRGLVRRVHQHGGSIVVSFLPTYGCTFLASRRICNLARYSTMTSFCVPYNRSCLYDDQSKNIGLQSPTCW